jgi:hypothetical protein
MFASTLWGYALVAESDRVVLISTIGAALIGAIFMVITTMMNNASANKRLRMDHHYQKKHSGMVGFLFGVIAILTVAGIYVIVTRPNDKADDASDKTTQPSTASVDTTAASAPTTTAASVTTTTGPIVAPSNVAVAPACAAFTVQVSAVRKTSTRTAEFESQAQLLAQALPALGELHRDAGDACGAASYNQYYFGPFTDGDATRAACFAIGQVLHDNVATYTMFESKGAINYPYFRIVDGISVTHPDGTPFVCDPAELTP